MIKRIRNNITEAYHCFHLLNKGILSLCFCSIKFYFEDLDQPDTTISTPSTMPIIKPILIFFIKTPNRTPNPIANKRETSPLLVSGF